MDALEPRIDIARYVLTYGTTDLDLDAAPPVDEVAALGLEADLGIPFPAGLAPEPQPIDPAPAIDAPLPKADVVVITWTVAENDALADVLTPGFGRLKWYRYARDFDERYRGQIRNGAPSLQARPPRLGSYMPTRIADLSVLCMKSELHLNQDGISDPNKPGTATLPVKDFFLQIIEEVEPKLVCTIGTSGSVKADFPLGDVVVTRAAKFRCHKEFRNEPFNDQVYKSDWTIPTQYFDDAEKLMQAFSSDLNEPPLGPPSPRYPWQGDLIEPPPNKPKIRLDGRDMPKFHPILTTDYFEYGTTKNNLFDAGCAVEMGDAALGLAATEIDDPPNWVVVRNMSDPEINGDLPTKEYHLNPQTMWAVGFYTGYGYWTSVTGALATWAILAGLAKP